MEPTHIFAIRELHSRPSQKPDSAEVDAFYSTHAPVLKPALSRMRAALTGLWHRLNPGRARAAYVAPLTHRG